MLPGQAGPLAANDTGDDRGTDRNRRQRVAVSADAVCIVSVAAVVLAAGASRRLRRPKQNVVLGGETLLARTIRIAGEAGLSPVIVVVRESTELDLRDVCIVVNEAADEGMASSIRCGVRAAERHQLRGAVLLTCDQPGVSSGHIQALIANPARLTASAYGDTIGIPAYFPLECFSRLLELHGDVGARSMLKTAYSVRAEELRLDVDTEEDLKAARILIERGSGS